MTARTVTFLFACLAVTLSFAATADIVWHGRLALLDPLLLVPLMAQATRQGMPTRSFGFNPGGVLGRIFAHWVGSAPPLGIGAFFVPGAVEQ